MTSTIQDRRRINVLHLDHSAESGGAELALVRLVNEGVDWNPSIMIPKQIDDSLGVFEKIKKSVDIKTLGPLQTAGVTTNTSASKLLRFVTQLFGQSVAIRFSSEFKKADVIHANTSRSGLYGALACIGTKKKLILHLRDQVSRESLGAVGAFAFRHLALRRADGLIGNSHSTLLTATERMKQKWAVTTVIPSPMGMAFSSAQRDLPAHKAERSPLRIGMVARIDPWKGQSLLIEAFGMAFPSSDEQLFFAGGCLFGHQEYMDLLREKVVSLGLEKRVHFLGHVDEVRDVIQNLDVCVQASLRPEPLGQNVLQYLAAGRAVVVSGEGGPTEWVTPGKNGLLFEPRSAGALAEALKTLALDRDLVDRLQREAALTPGLLTDAQVAESHGDIFRQVAQ